MRGKGRKPIKCKLFQAVITTVGGELEVWHHWSNSEDGIEDALELTSRLRLGLSSIKFLPAFFESSFESLTFPDLLILDTCI